MHEHNTAQHGKSEELPCRLFPSPRWARPQDNLPKGRNEVCCFYLPDKALHTPKCILKCNGRSGTNSFRRAREKENLTKCNCHFFTLPREAGQRRSRGIKAGAGTHGWECLQLLGTPKPSGSEHSENTITQLQPQHTNNNASGITPSVSPV